MHLRCAQMMIASMYKGNNRTMTKHSNFVMMLS